MSNYESQRENTTNNEQPPRRKKRKKRGSGCLSFLIYILFVAGVSFALSALAITVANDMFGLVQDDTPVMMSLEEGAAVDEVAVVLKDHQLIDHKWAFKLYCKLKHVETFSTGEFELASNMDYGQLISELRRANQKSEQPKNERITSGILTVDSTERNAYKGDQCVDLTAKEFDLIELLIHNPGRVFSRENLLDTVWGYEFRSDIRTVDVHIRRLREKLEPNPADPEYILTKWGVGYYFKA